MTKKLSLNRETLRSLSTVSVRTVVGAASQFCNTDNCLPTDVGCLTDAPFNCTVTLRSNVRTCDTCDCG